MTARPTSKPSRLSERATVLAAGTVSLLVLAFGGYIKGSRFLTWAPLDITVIAALGVTALIIVNLMEGASSPKRSSWLVSLILACGVGLLATGTTANSYAATKPLHVFAIAPLCAIGGAVLLARPLARHQWVVAVATLGVLVLLLARLDPSLTAGDRLATEGGNTIGAGRATGAAVVVFMLGALYYKRYRLPLLALATVSTYGAILAASRGPLVAAGIGIAIAVLLSKSRGRAVRLGGLAIVITAFAAWALRFEGLNSRLTTLSDDSATIRRYMWRQSWQQTKEHPLGIGWGRQYEASGIALLDSGYIQYPHNVFLETSSEAGWVAGILLIIVVILAVKEQTRLATRPVESILLGLLVFAIVNSMVSGDINSNRGLWVALGMAFATRAVRGKFEAEGRPSPPKAPTRPVDLSEIPPTPAKRALP